MQLTKNGIVFQKVRQRLGVGEIVRRDKLNVGVIQASADYISPNASEAVNSYFNWHPSILEGEALKSSRNF